jgi:hypothetical protein
MAELATKTDLLSIKLAIKSDLLAMTQDLQKELRTMTQVLNDSLERLALRLTVRFGVMMVVWVAAAAAILKPARHPASWLNCLF